MGKDHPIARGSLSTPDGRFWVSGDGATPQAAMADLLVEIDDLPS